MKRFVIALFAVAFASTALAADAGAETFAKKCAACHGKDANGGGMYKQSIRGKPEATVVKTIKEGKGKMKPVAIDNADEVAKYVSGLK
jgi:cytochrome c6